MRESSTECGRALSWADLWEPGFLGVDHLCSSKVYLCLECSTISLVTSMTKVPSLSKGSDSDFSIVFPGS